MLVSVVLGGVGQPKCEEVQYFFSCDSAKQTELDLPKAAKLEHGEEQSAAPWLGSTEAAK